MTIDQAAFQPAHTVTLNVSSTTSSIAAQPARERRHARLYNGGTVTVFIEIGDSSVVASTATGMPLPAGAVEIIGIGETNIAAVTASGSSVLYITPGQGV